MIFQIVPRAPGSREGVGDYARILATKLAENHGLATRFVSAQPAADGWTLGEISDAQWRAHPACAIVLHYVSYGYQARGVPRSLPQKMRRIQQLCGGRILTVFHELYARGSWRQSAFWLQPVQRRIARALARLSAACLVSSHVLAEQLQRLAPGAPVVVRPVCSTWGEPPFAEARDPRRWVVCGGTELIRRSLRSFPEKEAELFVVGGAEQPELRQRFDRVHYLPNVDAAVASALLSTCAFGWLDYFEQAEVPTAAILKSTAFAACCAHGVLPVLPAPVSQIDGFPGPLTPATLPDDSERPALAHATYDWYQGHASAAQLAATVAEMIAA